MGMGQLFDDPTQIDPPDVAPKPNPAHYILKLLWSIPAWPMGKSNHCSSFRRKMPYTGELAVTVTEFSQY